MDRAGIARDATRQVEASQKSGSSVLRPNRTMNAAAQKGQRAVSRSSPPQ